MDNVNEDLNAFKDTYFGMENASVQEKWNEFESEVKKTIIKRRLQSQIAFPGLIAFITDFVTRYKSVYQGQDVKEQR